MPGKRTRKNDFVDLTANSEDEGAAPPQAKHAKTVSATASNAGNGNQNESIASFFNEEDDDGAYEFMASTQIPASDEGFGLTLYGHVGELPRLF
jgi:hypothetical protein